MAIRPFKTNRNLSQYAAKKVLGKAHTRGDISDLQESLPSNIQLSAATIFADPIPAGPADEVPTLVWDSVETIQYVSLDAVEIAGTRYDADSSSDLGGEDTNNTNGPHAWYLKLPDDYETVSAGSHSGVGEGYFINAQPLYETLGKLQIVPTNFYINPADPAINPYAPKIYTWDGSTESSKSNIPLTPNDSLDWFFDPYNGIVFFQEHDGRVPYKVECYLYIGAFADDGLGGGSTVANAVGGLSRYFKKITQTTVPNTAVQIPNLNLEGLSWDPEEISVYLNGQLLNHGSAIEVQNLDGDYTLTATGPNTYITLNQGLEPDDLITVLLVQTSSIADSNFLLHTDDLDLPNARVITAGDGISIDTTNPREFLISNTGIKERIKHHEIAQFGYIGAPSDGTGDIYTFQANIDFSTLNYNDGQIDIFIDGRLRIKDLHYSLGDSDANLAVNQIRLLGDERLEIGKTISAILFT